MTRIDGETLTDESDLFTTGVIDSFGMIELISYLERAFGIKLEDQEINSPALSTLSGIVGLVEAKRGKDVADC